MGCNENEDCRACGHPTEIHCGHDMMCNHLDQATGQYCNCWDSDQ